MWSSTNQRIKALMSARAREKDRLTRPIYVRRTELVLRFRSDDDFLVEVPARALLNDFTPAGFYAYAATHLNPNVEISIQIDHPKRFNLTAKVVWCQYQASSSHVLTAAQSYSYRVALALLWKDAAQEAEFKKFCEELSGLYVSKKGLFIEEAFPRAEAPAPTPDAAASADPFNVPAPSESDEGAAPTDEQVAAELAADETKEAAAPAAPTDAQVAAAMSAETAATPSEIAASAQASVEDQKAA